MSDTYEEKVDQFEEGGEQKETADEFSLIPQPKINKKLLRAGVAAGGGALALIMSYGVGSQPTASEQAAEEERQAFQSDPPSELMLRNEDYGVPEEERELTEEDERDGAREIPAGLEPPQEQQQQEEQYRTYDRGRSVQVEERDNRTVTQNDANTRDNGRSNRVTYNPQNGAVMREDRQAEQQEEQARRAGLFFNTTGGGGAGGGQPPPASGEQQDAQEAIAEQIAQMESRNQAQFETDYEKQNQQRQKEDWLEGRQTSYSNYIEDPATYPISATREVKAGTVIPITMLTAINSDLPGEISAQIVANVYDTVSGQNLLIPAGSKLVGSYDSSIAFGQDRVLLAWQRIIRPDGVSLELQGMQGVDQAGRAGVTGEVDRHIDEIAGAVGVATTFDLVSNSLTAWIASNEMFSALGQRLETDDKEELAERVAQEYVDKVLNQQPTIRVAPGTRASLFINKDLVIPLYDDWRGGL